MVDHTFLIALFDYSSIFNGIEECKAVWSVEIKRTHLFERQGKKVGTISEN